MSENQGTATASPGTAGNSQAQSESHGGLSRPGLESGASQKTDRGNAPAIPGAKEGGKEGQAPTAAEIRKLKLKIYGREEEMDEGEVIKLAQQGAAAQKRFMEAAKKEREVQQIFAALRDKNNLRAALMKVGYSEDDIDNIAEETLAAKLERRMLQETNPDKLRANDLERKLKEREDADKKAEESRKAEDYAKVVARERERMDTELSEAAQATGLPKTPWVVDRFVKYMKRAITLGYEDVSPADVVKLVKEDYRSEHNNFYDGLTDMNQAIEYLSPKFLDKVREWDKARLKNPNAPAPFAVEPNQKPMRETVEKSSKRLSKEEWKKRLDERTR